MLSEPICVIKISPYTVDYQENKHLAKTHPDFCYSKHTPSSFHPASCNTPPYTFLCFSSTSLRKRAILQDSAALKLFQTAHSYNSRHLRLHSSRWRLPCLFTSAVRNLLSTGVKPNCRMRLSYGLENTWRKAVAPSRHVTGEAEENETIPPSR